MSIGYKGKGEDDSKLRQMIKPYKRLIASNFNQSDTKETSRILGNPIIFIKDNMECQFPTTVTRIKPAGAHRGAGSPSW